MTIRNRKAGVRWIFMLAFLIKAITANLDGNHDAEADWGIACAILVVAMTEGA